MLQDVEAHPKKVNLAVLDRNMLSELGFYEVWLQQVVGSLHVFISLFKQRLIDNYVINYKHTVELFFQFAWILPIL